MVSERVKSIAPSAIHEMTRLAAGVDDPAMLSWAKPTADTPEHIKEAAKRALDEGRCSGYTPTAGLPALREAIAEKLARDNGLAADPAEIIVTVGAIEGLSAAVMALADPGDEVLTPTPNYSTHIRQIRVASAVPVFVPTLEEEGWRLDLEALKDKITPRTKAFLFCSPVNPTGAVFGPDVLEPLAEILAEHDVAVITDESYEYFTFDGVRHVSPAVIPGMAERTVSTFTFTKTYAMTGWRVGYLWASKDLCTQIMKVHIPFAISAPTVSQYAALAALEGPQECVREFGEKYLKLRDLTCERLERLPHVFSYQRPRGSYCMFPKIVTPEGRDSLAFCKRLLLEGRVSMTPGVAFGPTGEGHARITFCDSADTIDKAFDRMEEYFPAA
jgi:aminotransferase